VSRLRVLLAPALLATTLGCSCMGSVVVANTGDHPVAVFLTPERQDSSNKYCDCPHGYRTDSYLTTATVDPKSLARAPWTPVDSGALHWDTTGRAPRLTVAVVLPPGHTLRIGAAAYDCGGGVIGQDLPAQIEIVDGDRQIRLDPIAFKDRARQATKFLLMYEVGAPPAAPGS